MRDQRTLILSGSTIAAVDSTDKHINRMKFKGVLVRLDEPSTKPPNGSDGHKILVSTSVAQQRLSTLIGMGLNYASTLDTHAQRRKVGVIEKAYIKGRDLWVEATIWKHDFPEATKDLKQSGLGMSMELGNVSVEDENANIWTLTDFCFLGATVLKKTAAAYYRTSAIAASLENRKGETMAVTNKKKPAEQLSGERIAEIAAAKTTELINGSILGVLKRQTKTLAAQSELIEGISTRLDLIELNSASTVDEEDDVDASSDENVDATEDTEVGDMKTKMKAKKDKEDCKDSDDDEDCDDEMDSSIDDGDLDDMGPDLGDEGTPGHLNPAVKNKGHKTTSEDKVGKTISKGVTGSQYKTLFDHVKKLTTQVSALSKENGKLKKVAASTSKQVTSHAREVERRSVSGEMGILLAKSGLDPLELIKTDTKLTVAEMDAVLNRPGLNLDVTKRMALKNEMRFAGLMEDGRVGA